MTIEMRHGYIIKVRMSGLGGFIEFGYHKEKK